MKKLTFLLLLVVITAQVSGQSRSSAKKIGFINYQELIMAMPENDSAAKKVEIRTQEYVDQIDELQNELNQKYQAFLLSRDSLSPLIRKTKEDQINQLRNNIQNFNASADQEIQLYRQEVYQPVIDKANNAVKAYAKENGYKIILDATAIVYFDEEDPDNVLEGVKAAIGLK